MSNIQSTGGDDIKEPMTFIKDGQEVEVSIDTTTPSNSNLLPVNLYNENGERGTESNKISVVDTELAALISQDIGVQLSNKTDTLLLSNILEELKTTNKLLKLILT